MMKRPVDHLQQFVLAEFGTEGAIAGQATARAEGQGQDGQLVLKAAGAARAARACCGGGSKFLAWVRMNYDHGDCFSEYGAILRFGCFAEYVHKII